MNNYDNVMLISADVYSVIKSMNDKGWKTLRESSINRIIYLTAILFTFMYENEKNIFEDTYKFSITLSGPEDSNISKAIINLESNYAISSNNEGLFIFDKEYIFNFKDYPLFDKKSRWIEDISYIIGIYGEEKIYDFIFRDPQYQFSKKTNSLEILDLTENNATVLFLKEFKTEFEKYIKFNSNSLSNRKYLELYFEYVFGKIVRGDI